MKFSIVIPVYNGSEHLPKALSSILEQSFSDWECVIVDDGSTDNTLELATSYARSDKRIRVIHQSNGGVSVARNCGMDEAKGEWIVWLDADDFYVSGSLEQIALLTEKHPECSCFQFPYWEIQKDDVLLPCISAAYDKWGGHSYTGKEAFDILFSRKASAGINWQPWRFVYRRDSLPHFREKVIHEDLDVLPLHLATLAHVFIVKEAYYAYLPARIGAATECFNERRVRDILDVTSHVYEQLANSPLPSESKKGFKSMLAYNLFGFYLATSHFSEPARTELFDVFAKHPEWLTAINTPARTAWLKKMMIIVLGVRNAALLYNFVFHKNI